MKKSYNFKSKDDKDIFDESDIVSLPETYEKPKSIVNNVIN